MKTSKSGRRTAFCNCKFAVLTAGIVHGCCWRYHLSGRETHGSTEIGNMPSHCFRMRSSGWCPTAERKPRDQLWEGTCCSVDFLQKPVVTFKVLQTPDAKLWPHLVTYLKKIAGPCHLVWRYRLQECNCFGKEQQSVFVQFTYHSGYCFENWSNGFDYRT